MLWVTAMAVSVIFSIRSTLRVERAERQEYSYRLPLQTQGFLNSSPQSTGDGVRYSAFTFTGYHLVTQQRSEVELDPHTDAGSDDLSFTSGFGHTLVERASSPHSRIVDLQNPTKILVDDARDPMLSSDGRDLAFLRDDHGRGQIMLRRAFEVSTTETPLTPPHLNVYEASFLSDQKYAFSADEDGSSPRIFLTDMTHTNTPIVMAESRYPALSPDGRWMAYSRLDHGVWNLWLRDARQRLVAPHRRRAMQSDSAVMGERLKNLTLWHRLRQKRLVYCDRSQEGIALMSFLVDFGKPLEVAR